MFIESVTVSSEREKNSGEPLRSGLIFTSNYIGNFSNIDSDKFGSMNQSDYQSYAKKKQSNQMGGDDKWLDWEPVGYFKIDGKDKEVSAD